MKEKNKCEEIGFQHNWKDTTSNMVYASMPPQYPPRERTCINCGKRQIETIIQREIKEWKEINY